MKKQEQTKRLADVLTVLAHAPESVEAWQQLYELMWPFVLAVNYRVLRSARHLAEDASQEVFLRVVQYCNFAKLQDPEVFRAYLGAVCINVCRNYLKQIIKEMQPSGSAETEPVANFEWSPEHHAEAQELLTEVLKQLTDVDRKLVLLLIQGYKLPEIVTELGLSYENATVRLHRLRAKLRMSLELKA